MPEGMVETPADDLHAVGQPAARVAVCGVGLVGGQRHAVLHLHPLHPVGLELAEVALLPVLFRSTRTQLDLDAGGLHPEQRVSDQSGSQLSHPVVQVLVQSGGIGCRSGCRHAVSGGQE